MQNPYPRVYSEKPLIIAYSLNEENSDKELIGNKAKSLIKLSGWGFHVPDAHFLDKSFYDHFLENNDLPEPILECFHQLPPLLAVRSSSNLEDGDLKSYAGMFKTILNVPNQPDTLRNAILECYQSFSGYVNSTNADKNSIPDRVPYMGIIIQAMIPPKISGIVFTCPVVNPDENLFQIEFCAGFGDQLTGGYVSGDSILLNPADGKIVQQTGHLFIAQESINQLWKIVKRLAEKSQNGQDAEFVISDRDGQIYLVQSRPITAVQYTPDYVIQKENLKLQEIFEAGKKKYVLSPVLSGSNVTELFPVATPLSYSIFKTIFAGTETLTGAYNTGRAKLGYAPITFEEQKELFLTIGNQARTNLLIHALIYRLNGFPQNLYLEKQVSHYLNKIQNQPEKGNYAQFGVYLQNPTRAQCLEFFEEKGDEIYQIYSNFMTTLLTDIIPATIASAPKVLIGNQRFYFGEIQKDKSEDNKKKIFEFDENGTFIVREDVTLTQIAEKSQAYLEYLRTEIGVTYVIVARLAFLASDIVKDLLEKLYKNHKNVLFRNQKIKDVCELLNTCFNGLLAYGSEINKKKYPVLFRKKTKNYNPKTSLNSFREVSGHTGSFDISQKRLGELEDTVLNNLLLTQEGSKAQADNHRNRWVTNFFEKIEKITLTEEFQHFREWIEHAAYFMLYRELLKSELLKIFYLLRVISEKIGHEIKFGDLIYFLEWEELQKCLVNQDHYLFLALKRKAYFQACQSIDVGSVIMENNSENIKKKTQNKNNMDGEYKTATGTTICQGEAEGFCLIARDSIEFHEKLTAFRKEGIENIIGVFKSVEPAYFKICELNGFVTEFGGFLAHAATIAREYNIPYITDVKIDLFQDGDNIRFETAKNKLIYTPKKV